MTVSRVFRALGPIALAAIMGCLPHIGYEGVDSRSLKDPGNSVISKEDLRSIPDGQNLTIYMSKKHCDVRGSRRYASLDLSKPVGALITDVMCSESYRGYGQAYTRRIHFALDDRDFDHLFAAIALVICTGEESCKGDKSLQLAWYAESIDREAVRKRLEALVIHDEIKLAFLRRADASSALILKRVREQTPANRAILRDLQFDVREKRATHWASYAEHWKRFDELHPRVDAAALAGKNDLDLLDEVRSLRDDYVRDCQADNHPLKQCLFGQLGRPILVDLVRVAIAAKKPVLARAENAILVEADARHTAADDIATAQLEALSAAKARKSKIRSARESGVDAATIRTTFGEEPAADFYKSLIWFRPQRKRQNYIDLIHELGPTAKLVSRVVGVKIRKARAEISISKYGGVPLNVPASDAAGLKPGDSITTMLRSKTDRTGYVALVKRGYKLIGARGLRERTDARAAKP